ALSPTPTSKETLGRKSDVVLRQNLSLLETSGNTCGPRWAASGYRNLPGPPSTAVVFPPSSVKSEDALCWFCRMPPSPSRAPPALSDMTQYWDRRAKLIGEQTISNRHLRRGGAGLNLVPATRTLKPEVSDREGLARTPVTKSATNGRANVQVTLLTFCLLGLMFVLTFTVQPVMATNSDELAPNNKSWIEEQYDHVIFRSQKCQRKPTDDLARELRMAESGLSDDDELISEKRDYQQDDPGNLTPEGVDLDSIDNRRLAETLERDMYIYDTRDDKVLEEEDVLMDRRTWLPRRKVLKRGLARARSMNRRLKQEVENDRSAEGVPSSPEYPYMRRRRRTADIPESPSLGLPTPSREDSEFEEINKENSIDRMANDGHPKEKKEGDWLLKLHEKSHNKILRRQIKKKIRKNPKLLEKTPWSCTLKTSTMKSPLTFPRSYTEGECTQQKKCFYNLYVCQPQKISMKYLYRDKTRCNPLPKISNVTVFEERWEIGTRYVTVGCNCVSAISKQTKVEG
ncbi:CAunnamed protein product, partial [Biomphalaria glabrata]